MTKTSSSKALDKQVGKYLDQNPRLKEALKVFNMSNTEYRKAMESVTQKPAITTSNTTDYHGNVARDN